MTVTEQFRPEQVTFTALGDDRYRCDLCGKEVRGYRGMGGHKGLHTGQARAKFRRRAHEAATPAYRPATDGVPGPAEGGRVATLSRQTLETEILLTLGLDGSGKYAVETGSGILDHLLAQLARHGLFDLALHARGDATGWHHLVEDVGITLGRALRQALGDGRGIVRMGHALVPMDDALAQVAVDLSGRGYATVDSGLGDATVEGLPAVLVEHLLEALAVEARITLHARVLAGRDPHHRAEALFKALARALRDAVAPDPRLQGQVPSTKGTIAG